MHASIDPPKALECRLNLAARSAVKRVVNPDLEVRVRVECCKTDVVAGGEHVVDQQAHAHAAVGGLQEFGDERTADDVILDQVVLDVDAALGRLGENNARGKRVDAVG